MVVAVRKVVLGLAVVGTVAHVGAALALRGRADPRPAREARAIAALRALARTRAPAPGEEVEGYALRVEASGVGSWSATALPVGHGGPGVDGWTAYRGFFVDASGVVRACAMEPAAATAEDPEVAR